MVDWLNAGSSGQDCSVGLHLVDVCAATNRSRARRVDVASNIVESVSNSTSESCRNGKLDCRITERGNLKLTGRCLRKVIGGAIKF